MALSDARHAAESTDPQLALEARRNGWHLRHPSETFASVKPPKEDESPQPEPRPTVADGQDELQFG